MMGHQKQSHAINFVIVFVFSLLFLVPYADAQSGDAASSQDGFVMENQIKISPLMAIFLIGLIAVLFMLGCFSIYSRRCFENNSGDGLVTQLDANRRSRRAYLRGLDPAVIDTFPTFHYSDVKGLKISMSALECAVCLNEFEDDETLRLLPKCCHVFHPECIDAWLVSHVTCPVCRANLVPVPGEENGFDVQSRDSVVTELTQPTQPTEGEHEVHEISELAMDIHIGSPEVIELPQLTNRNRPPRPSPKRPLIDGKFSRSHSTGHSLIQLGEDYERFTLRLSTDLQKKFNKPELRRAKSNVAFPTAKSSKKGYRSASVRTGREKNNYSYERENRLDRWSLTMTPPFVPRSHSVQLPKEGVSTHNSLASGSLLKSVKSPFDRLFGETEKDDVGERSFTKLMGSSPI